MLFLKPSVKQMLKTAHRRAALDSKRIQACRSNAFLPLTAILRVEGIA
jgi:hypothetical protein